MRLVVGACQSLGLGAGTQELHSAGTERAPDGEQVASVEHDIVGSKAQSDQAGRIIADASQVLVAEGYGTPVRLLESDHVRRMALILFQLKSGHLARQTQRIPHDPYLRSHQIVRATFTGTEEGK